MTLDAADLRMARVALSYYVRAHEISRRPVPLAATRLAERLQRALMSANGLESPGLQVDWLSTREVARRQQCSQRTAQRLAERIGRQFGRDWFIPADALEEVGDVVADK